MCYMCFVVAMAIAAQELVLEVLQALTSNTQIVKETMQKGVEATTLKLCLTGAEKNWKESLTHDSVPLAMEMILSIISMRVDEPGNA